MFYWLFSGRYALYLFYVILMNIVWIWGMGHYSHYLNTDYNNYYYFFMLSQRFSVGYSV